MRILWAPRYPAHILASQIPGRRFTFAARLSFSTQPALFTPNWTEICLADPLSYRDETRIRREAGAKFSLGYRISQIPFAANHLYRSGPRDGEKVIADRIGALFSSYIRFALKAVPSPRYVGPPRKRGAHNSVSRISPDIFKRLSRLRAVSPFLSSQRELQSTCANK